MALDLDLNATTIAVVKATVDARLESAWRVSGLRVLWSDCGVKLKYQNMPLAVHEGLSSYKIGKGMTLYTEWPQKSERSERRKRYGEGLDGERKEGRKACQEGLM